MCTVSFIPLPGKLFITSNRDESARRPPASAPCREETGNYSIIGPRDGLAGGRWIALRNDGVIGVLLNGAVEKHQPQPPYARSRGQVFSDVLAADDPMKGFDRIDLARIEPFTMVLWQNGKLHEMYWDGEKRVRLQKDPGIAWLWSSCTLYSPEVKVYRERFFREWMAAQKEFPASAIQEFHLYRDPGGEEEKDIRIDRKGEMLTVSVSCIEIGEEESLFHYTDLAADKKYSLCL